MSRLLSAAAIAVAAEGLRDIAVHTPLLSAPWLRDEVDGEVRLKCESLQRTGAFKIRGAYTMISRLPKADRRRGVVTYSSGNHAQAVALAASLFDTTATVVMPTTAPRAKVEGARRLGAEIVFDGTTSLERRERAEAIASERRLTIVPPFDHADIIAGQGSVGFEILHDWPAVEAVLVPIGGGGLISGIAAWIKRNKPGCEVVGVEPESANAMSASVEAGELTTLESADTVADGLAPVRPGTLTFAHARALVDTFVTVDDAAVVEATRRLRDVGKLVVEPSGAATLAALTSGRWTPGGRPTAVVLSGGNLDPDRLPEPQPEGAAAEND